MRVIGSRIKEQRLLMGLSQQQLGGKELTRAFVSLLEQGKTHPSLKTLELIAGRLEKPVEYFLSNEGDSDIEAVAILERALGRCMERKDWPAAIEHAQSALSIAAHLGSDARVEVRILSRLAHARLHSRHLETAMELYERLVDKCRLLNDNNTLAEAWFEKGVTHQLLEDYPSAERCYRQAARLAEGKKSLSHIRTAALINLGSASGFMGAFDQAVEAYELALEEIDPGENPKGYGDACYGLSLCLGKQRRWKEAAYYARQALECCRKSNPHQVVHALYAMARIEVETEQLDQAITHFQECRELHQSAGNVRGQAWVLSSMAQIYLRMDQAENAREACREALAFLDLDDDGILRGILYRQLGEAFKASGDVERAREWLSISVNMLRRLRASDDLKETLRLLNEA